MCVDLTKYLQLCSVKKNQNKCCKITGIPFSFGLKNIELWFFIIIVIPLAKTGINEMINIDVIMIDQQYRVRLF